MGSAIVGPLCAFMTIRMAFPLSIEHRAWQANRVGFNSCWTPAPGWMPFCRIQSVQMYMAAMEIHWRVSLGVEVEDAA